MIKCRLIEVTTGGSYFREAGWGRLTKFISTDRLLETFESLESHPAFQIKPDLEEECIILRNKVNGNNVDIEYEDTPKTERFRSNLKKINECFLKHWADLRIKDTEV